jgi:hypothetical protein
MTILSILSSHKKSQFDAPPIFNTSSRALYFSLDNNMVQFVETLRSSINQAGFVLQLGYFRSNGKFLIHINTAHKILNISAKCSNSI